MNTVAVFIMSVVISHTASERSGMLACNPNDKTKKPVIYAFDGKHLIKDNDPTIPYKHMASITDQFDVYFALVPTVDYQERKAEYNKARAFAIENYETIQKVISDVYILCFQNHADKCNLATSNPFGKTLTLDLISEGFNFSPQELLKWQNKIKLYLNIYSDIKAFKLFEFKAKNKKLIDSFVEKKLTYNLNTDFHHVKLTLDFEEMRVIEQSSLRIEQIKRTEFVNNTYECQSLGVTVPEIDTSESTTPIGEKNL